MARPSSPSITLAVSGPYIQIPNSFLLRYGMVLQKKERKKKEKDESEKLFFFFFCNFFNFF